jgi:hypothetical protein
MRGACKPSGSSRMMQTNQSICNRREQLETEVAVREASERSA